MSKKHSGSCLCEEVEFEVVGSFEKFILCHCKHCQKDTGSAHGANLFSSYASLRWIKGQENVSTFNLPSTLHVKSFCKVCGSALPNLQFDETIVVVPAGSLDTEVEMKPNAHIFCASRARWDHELDTVEKFDHYIP